MFLCMQSVNVVNTVHYVNELIYHPCQRTAETLCALINVVLLIQIGVFQIFWQEKRTAFYLDTCCQVKS